MSYVLRLKDFNISEKTGFLPEQPPLKRLPDECFSPWEDLMEHLPQLIKDKTLREEVHKLPDVEFSEKTLKNEREWQRANVLLTFISQAYIWIDGDNCLVDTVPRKLAVPWSSVSEHLGIPPVATYVSVVSYNYAVKDPSKPIAIENVVGLGSFTGELDESWFYMIHVCVEKVAIPGLNALEKSYFAMAEQNNDTLAQELKIIRKSIEDMTHVTNRMYEHCDAKFFYVDLRVFLAGSEGIESLPDGIIYEGVDEKPKKYGGGSGGQSAAVHSFDIFLGVEHTASDLEFVKKMRENMPKKHREFLDVLKQQPSVKEYVMQSNHSELILSYNQALEALKVFRSKHVVLATRYVVLMKKHTTNNSLEETGTSGIPSSIEYLKRVRDDTESAKVKV